MTKPLLCAGALGLSCAFGSARALPPTFAGLGFVSGSTHSEAYGMSADGSVIVGYSDTGGGTSQAFTYSSGALTGIGDLAGGTVASAAFCASSDGSIVGGQGNSANGTEAFKYNGSFTPMGGTVPGGFFGSSVNASSSSGVRLAGARELSGFRVEACRWNNTSIFSLGFLVAGGSYSFAWGMSGDGLTIVGGSDAAAGYEAFRWNSGVMVSLGDLHTGGTTNSEAFAISRDGTTVVGFGTTALNHAHAFRWTSADGMVDLGDLPGGSDYSAAQAVNADGSVIVGRASGLSTSAEAFVWDAVRGMRPLRAVLVDLGLDMTGWTLSNATAVSDDGLTIAGYGVNPSGQTEAWVVTLPCLSDYDHDGFVSGDDFDAFVADFENGLPAADVNQDTFTSGDDFDAYVAAFEKGC